VRAHNADQAGAHSSAFDDAERLGELGAPQARQKRDPARRRPHDGGVKGEWPQGVVTPLNVERDHSRRGTRQRVLCEHIRRHRAVNSAHVGSAGD
jgi:hypothetical protein